MILSTAPAAYDRADQASLRDTLQRADAENLKRGRDVELGRGRLIVNGEDAALAVESLRQLARKTGAGHILAWMNIGSVPHALVKESMERFAADVVPKL